MDRRLTNPKGSHVYRKMHSGNDTTQKGANVYSNVYGGFDSTPSPIIFFYKHQIPSGLFLNRIEADIQKGLAELKEWI